jgi:hypothetical protein
VEPNDGQAQNPERKTETLPNGLKQNARLSEAWQIYVTGEIFNELLHSHVLDAFCPIHF